MQLYYTSTRTPVSSLCAAVSEEPNRREGIMLRLAVVLSLVAVCIAQTPTRPVISETFASSGEFEFHDTRGTFFGEFIIDRDQSANEGVENATYKVGNVVEHYEDLDRYDMGERYTVRFNGTETPHCAIEKITGNLPMFWGWIAQATYIGKKEIHEIEYDAWGYEAAGVELVVLVPEDDTHTPKYLTRKTGQTIFAFSFMTFNPTTPPSEDFVVPKECTDVRRINRIPFYSLKPSI